MKNPCANCPFVKGNTWFTVAYKIAALQELDKQKIFACHMKHQTENIFSVNQMKENDCVGFKMMQANMTAHGTYSNVVDCFNETFPEYNLTEWGQHEKYQSALNLI